MKFLKYLLLFLLIAIVLGLVYVAMQPSDYNVSRSKIIKQPLAKAFNTVNDFKTWEKWGPWHDEDSTIVTTYGNKTSGIGASQSWTSKDGPGSMKTIAVEPNKSIHQEITFADNEPGEILWDFEKVGEGTKVTWTMKDDKAPFIFKTFSALSGGWDNMLGPMLDNGLSNLDGVVTNMPDPFKLSEVSVFDMDEKFFIGYPYSMKIDPDAMKKAFDEAIPKSYQKAMEAGINPTEITAGALYYKWDEEKGETDFRVGIFVNEDKTPEGMEQVKVGGGKFAKISKFGPYGQGDMEAHTAIGNYLKANNCEPKTPIYEMYVNDPSKVKPEEVQTDIYYQMD